MDNVPKRPPRVMADFVKPQPRPQPVASKKPSKRRLPATAKRLIKPAAAVLLLLALAFFVWKYIDARHQINKLSSPQAQTQNNQQLIERVGKIVVLPEGETPTIATISDASKLKSQTFFADAQNGDEVLIYSQAKRAILYRPSVGKVIEIAPVNLGSSSGGSGLRTNQ